MDLAALFASAYGYSDCSIFRCMRSAAGNISQIEVIHNLTQIDSDKSFLHVDDSDRLCSCFFWSAALLVHIALLLFILDCVVSRVDQFLQFRQFIEWLCYLYKCM